jgi:transcriptional regulator of acetoin/glycerol metabolism
MANTSLLKKNNFESVKKAGRPNCLTDEKKENLLKAYFTYPYSVRQLADMFGVSRMTVWRTVNGG